MEPAIVGSPGQLEGPQGQGFVEFVTLMLFLKGLSSASQLLLSCASSGLAIVHSVPGPPLPHSLCQLPFSVPSLFAEPL